MKPLYAAAVGAGERDEPWNRLRRFRNELAHRRLADVDEGEVWRTTALRPEQLLAHVNDLIRRDRGKRPSSRELNAGRDPTLRSSTSPPIRCAAAPTGTAQSRGPSR